MSDIEWKLSEVPVEYEAALQTMEEHIQAIKEGKAEEMVWLLEHPPLYTAGTGAKEEDLLDPEKLPVYKTGRGGKYTYHGPGQRIAYIMINLEKRKMKDLKLYVHNLEQWIINALARFHVKGERMDGSVGIWVRKEDGSINKIAAIGVRVRKWITLHGISLNIGPDLSHYSGIIPCGITKHGVTSLNDLGIHTKMHQIDQVLMYEFEKIFAK